MSDAQILVRPATRRDLPVLGRLGALLVRLHHEFDPRRFVAPRGNVETGYAQFLGSQLGADDAVVLVAERDGAVIGYVYAGIEPFSWKELRDTAGFVHDVVVDPEARRAGAASALIEAAAAWVRSKHVANIMLGTAAKNTAAQALFQRLGFRATMIEMTRDA
jgi:ribosomal protein S18 acetylase RimI-like enzyme